MFYSYLEEANIQEARGSDLKCSLPFTLMLPWSFCFKVSEFTLIKNDSHFCHSFFCSVSSTIFAFHHLPAAGLMSGLLLESTAWFDSCPGVLAAGGIFKSIFLFF